MLKKSNSFIIQSSLFPHLHSKTCFFSTWDFSFCQFFHLLMELFLSQRLTSSLSSTPLLYSSNRNRSGSSHKPLSVNTFFSDWWKTHFWYFSHNVWSLKPLRPFPSNNSLLFRLLPLWPRPRKELEDGRMNNNQCHTSKTECEHEGKTKWQLSGWLIPTSTFFSRTRNVVDESNCSLLSYPRRHQFQWGDLQRKAGDMPGLA